jgi:hypothetical protein
MACIRAGIFEFDCGCSKYEKENLGCEVPTKESIWEDEDDAFYSCPFQFIAPCIFDFIERYDSIKSGLCSTLPFDSTPNRFLKAARIYESYYRRFYEEKNKGIR